MQCPEDNSEMEHVDGGGDEPDFYGCPTCGVTYNLDDPRLKPAPCANCGDALGTNTDVSDPMNLCINCIFHEALQWVTLNSYEMAQYTPGAPQELVFSSAAKPQELIDILHKGFQVE
jgi:hypothetical protein